MILHLDCKREGEDEAPLVPARAAVLAQPSAAKTPKAETRALVARPEPAFQIDGRDLSFLCSIGIDPTRRPRRKK